MSTEQLVWIAYLVGCGRTVEEAKEFAKTHTAGGYDKERIEKILGLA